MAVRRLAGLVVAIISESMNTDNTTSRISHVLIILNVVAQILATTALLSLRTSETPITHHMSTTTTTTTITITTSTTTTIMLLQHFRSQVQKHPRIESSPKHGKNYEQVRPFCMDRPVKSLFHGGPCQECDQNWPISAVTTLQVWWSNLGRAVRDWGKPLWPNWTKPVRARSLQASLRAVSRSHTLHQQLQGAGFRLPEKGKKGDKEAEPAELPWTSELLLVGSK